MCRHEKKASDYFTSCEEFSLLVPCSCLPVNVESHPADLRVGYAFLHRPRNARQHSSWYVKGWRNGVLGKEDILGTNT